MAQDDNKMLLVLVGDFSTFEYVLYQQSGASNPLQ